MIGPTTQLAIDPQRIINGWCPLRYALLWLNLLLTKFLVPKESCINPVWLSFRSWIKLTLLLGYFLSVSAQGAFTAHTFQDVNQAARFQLLIETLRCPKCQNNNLSDSDAPLAGDIKNYVYQSLKKGKSDEEIINFLISRYGIFIVYDPKIMGLWLVPIIIVLAVSLWGLRRIKTRSKPLSTELSTNMPSMEYLIAEYRRNQEDKKQ